jgi:hypothetical protein
MSGVRGCGPEALEDERISSVLSVINPYLSAIPHQAQDTSTIGARQIVTLRTPGPRLHRLPAPMYSPKPDAQCSVSHAPAGQACRGRNRCELAQEFQYIQ